MEKKTLARSWQMKGQLDDNYTLFDNGEVLHEYDKHMHPGGYNLKRTLKGSELQTKTKERLLEAASPENKEFVRKLLEL